jgi:hypothetical protein
VAISELLKKISHAAAQRRNEELEDILVICVFAAPLRRCVRNLSYGPTVAVFCLGALMRV